MLTGATGFLGKVVLEKLLWSLPVVKTIYLAIKPNVSFAFWGRGSLVSTMACVSISYLRFHLLGRYTIGVQEILARNFGIADLRQTQDANRREALRSTSHSEGQSHPVRFGKFHSPES